jgi:hypothetical protein
MCCREPRDAAQHIMCETKDVLGQRNRRKFPYVPHASLSVGGPAKISLNGHVLMASIHVLGLSFRHVLRPETSCHAYACEWPKPQR